MDQFCLDKSFCPCISLHVYKLSILKTCSHSHPITNLRETEKNLLAYIKVHEVGDFHHSKLPRK